MLFRQTTLERLERIEALKDGQYEDLDESDSEALEVTDMPVMLAHGGSNFGNLDEIMPLEYPLPPTHPLSPFSSIPHPSKAGCITLPPSSSSQPASAASVISGTDTTASTIVVQDIKLNLHTRPAELYILAWSTGGRMDIYCFYDNNVFEASVVEEWLNEIKGAVLWYLGRPHESHQPRKNGSGKAEAGPRQRQGGQAKL
ncbi:hypothetical protein JVU11DRAFT_10822 [Chiua virens]|nr:hypothetical protein JVU11DRAFT_10822 [Chiua virens]